MSGFYGGRRGASLEIVASYENVQEMMQHINEIDYNQYVITKDTNTLYRKLQDRYQEITTLSTGGGGASSSLNYKTILSEYNDLKNAYGSNAGYTENSYSTENGLIDGSLNKEIKYNTYFDSNTGYTYIGFEFPYPVIEFKTGENQNISFVKENSDNPFHQVWNVNLKESGGGGQSSGTIYFSNLRTVPAASVSSTVYNPLNDKIYDISEYKEKNSLVVLYNQTNTTNNTNKTYFFGEYNSISSIEVSETGVFRVTDLNNNSYTYEFNDIKEVSLENGIFKIVYKNGLEYTSNIIYPTSLNYDDDLNKISAIYSNGEKEYISNELNYIKKVIVTDNQHLLIYYSSPAFRAAHTTIEYNGEAGWIDYGLIRSDNGIYVGKNLVPSEISSSSSSITKETIITYLNQIYPQGLQGENLKGKLISVGYINDQKQLYAFDYDANEWYYLSDSGNQIDLTTTSFIGKTNTDSSILNDLPNGCIWFVTEEI